MTPCISITFRENVERTARILFFVVVLIALSGSPASSQDFDRNGSHWYPPSSVGNCGGSFSDALPFALQRKLVRGPNPRDNGRNFAHYVGIGLSRTMADMDVETFKKFIVSAAEAKSLTKPVFIDPDSQDYWGSPIYVQSYLLPLIAKYITYMDSKGLLTAEERKKLVDWGGKMISGQKKRRENGSVDSRVASGVALMSWGSLTDQRKLIKRGYRQYKEAIPFVIGNIGNPKLDPLQVLKHGKSKITDLDSYNLTLAHVIEGAAILENLGVRAFDAEYKGRTLLDAVDWWTSVIAAKPKEFQGYKRYSDNYHVGWIPIYLSKFPDRPVAPTLRRIAEEVSKGKRPMFAAISLGGPVDCFWGYQ